MNVRTYFVVAALGATLLNQACKSNEPSDDALVVEDGAKYPGNDGGVDRDDVLDTTSALSVGGVNSYSSDSTDASNYNKTLGAEEDNPNFNKDNTRTGGDPVTPNAPLADGSAGRLKNTGVNVVEDEGIAPAGGSTGAQQNNNDLNSDSPYGSNRASTGNQTQLGSDATNRPRVQAYGGGDVRAYVGSVYGNAAPTNTSAGGEKITVSAYQPAITDREQANYTETKRKFVPVTGNQNAVAYVPVVLSFTPVLTWGAAPTAPLDASAKTSSTGATASAKTPNATTASAKTSRTNPLLGEGCETASDQTLCTSEAFNEAIAPLLNDARVAASIAAGKISGFSFEIDKTGRVLANSLQSEKAGKVCSDADCDRLQAIMAAVLAQQRWTPAKINDQAVATRVYVPLSVQVVKV